MTKSSEMIGKKYGRLTVLQIDHYKTLKNGNKRTFLKCLCDCGMEKVICAYSLTTGLTRSCGCLQREVAKNNRRTHGMSNSRIYKIYAGMHKRCENKNAVGYDRYGGRGISVCEDWSGENGFIHFYEWSMNHGYADNLSIDRIDYNKGYSPDNCRWADDLTQANNSSWNTIVECHGERHSIAEWGRITGIKPSSISNRLRSGWNEGQALGYEQHITHHKDEALYTINGETHNIREWCRILNLSVETVRYRREHGWAIDEIFGFKERKHG